MFNHVSIHRVRINVLLQLIEIRILHKTKFMITYKSSSRVNGLNIICRVGTKGLNKINVLNSINHCLIAHVSASFLKSRLTIVSREAKKKQAVHDE